MKLFRVFSIAMALALLVTLTGMPLAAQADDGNPPNGNGLQAGPVAPHLQTPIAINGGWSCTASAPPYFTFGGVGSFAPEGPFTFTTTGPVVVQVTDSFDPGDQFRIYDNGVPIGDTSVPAGGVVDVCDPNLTYTDPNYSHGAFNLAAGSHSITIEAIASPWGGGAAYIQVLGAAISVSPASFDFGDVLVGTISATQAFTITNTGGLDLNINFFSWSGEFDLDPNTCFGPDVVPGGTCTFYVSFSPSVVGPQSTDMTIGGNATNGPNTVGLSGNGVSIPAGDNLLINPGYDDFITAPKAWLYSVVNTPLSSLRDCNYYISPGCSLKLQASRTTRVVTQTVNYNGVGGENFIYGLSSAAQNVPAGGNYRFEIALFNRFNRVMYTQTLWFSDGNHGWETLFDTFTAPAAFNKMRYRIYFQKGAGTAWFEDAFLMLWP